MTARQLVVVDVESSGLRDADLTVEVAWRNQDTGDHGEFVPAHNCAWVLRFGHPTALEMNGYRERLLDAPQDDGTEVARLHAALTGNALAGSNPGFDWYMHLSRLFRRQRLGQPQHHRMPDISNYAAGVLGIDPRELPGLARVCELLGVETPDHTAAGDVRATGECFQMLGELNTYPITRTLLRHVQEGRPDGTWGCRCGWTQDRPHSEHLNEMMKEART